MKSKDWETLNEALLFCGLDMPTLMRLTDEVEAAEFCKAAGEEILLTHGGDNHFGVVLSGSIQIFSDREKHLPLNRLQAGDLFGVSALFGEKGADTHLFAEGRVRVMLFSCEKAEPLWEHPVISKNLVRFLTDRIRFLNRKIALLATSDTETRLLHYLTKAADEKGWIRSELSLSRLAKSLNMGRASLYRALNKWEEEGLIVREGKKIRLTEKDTGNKSKQETQKGTEL